LSLEVQGIEYSIEVREYAVVLEPFVLRVNPDQASMKAHG
jgi:hypothetical protein